MIMMMHIQHVEEPCWCHALRGWGSKGFSIGRFDPCVALQVFKLQESLQGAARVPIVRHTSCAVTTTFPLEPASIISF